MPRHRNVDALKRALALSFLAALVWLVGTSTAAGEPACPAGNLLAGRTPIHASGMRDADRITDGFAGVEGAQWDEHQSALFMTAAAQVVYDLGQTARIAVLRVQASGNDAYAVSASLDGASWTPVWTAQPVGGSGLRLREATDLDVTARYLRLSAFAGDGGFSAAEWQAWCGKPEPWSLKVVMDPSVYAEERLRRLARATGPLTLGMLAFVVFAFLLARESGQTTWFTRWGSIAGASGMIVLAAVGVHGVIGGVAAAAAAAVLVGCLRRLGANAVQSGRAQLIGVLAGAAATAYLAAHLGATRSLPAAWLWGAYLTATSALRYGDRPWADWIPPLAGTAALSFALGMTWGAFVGIGVACGGAGAAALLRSQRPGETTVRWLDWLALLPLVAASPLVWTHFGQFHGNGQLIQVHDTFHYYMGSKYIREIGYTNLYHCAAVAEWEEGYARQLELRRIRDLRTNRLVPSRSMTSRPEICHEAFSAERWAAFRQDLRMFRALLGPRAWGDVFRDHGYNASPLWSLIGHLLSNADWRHSIRDVPAAASADPDARRHPHLATGSSAFLRDLNAFRRRLTSLALIDPVLCAGAFLMLGWAFGLRAMALATVVWAVGYPWSYAWIGGAFGRMFWLFSAVAAVCFLKKERHLLAGIGLSCSFLFRVFPAMLFTGVGLNLMRRAAQRVPTSSSADHRGHWGHRSAGSCERVDLSRTACLQGVSGQLTEAPTNSGDQPHGAPNRVLVGPGKDDGKDEGQRTRRAPGRVEGRSERGA
jgi:hypothetical protein